MAVSMTGYGRGNAKRPELEVSCELRSVNHRYLDLNIYLPSAFRVAETAVRDRVRGKIARGHLDVHIRVTDERESNVTLKVNRGLAEAYQAAIEEMAGPHMGDLESRACWVLEQRGVVEAETLPMDEDEVTGAIIEALDEALDQLVAMREEEGIRLTEDIANRLRSLDQLRGKVAELAAVQPVSLKERLEERLDELMAHGGGEYRPDPERLAQEAAILADKADVTEEILRLASHLQQLKDKLHAEGSEGRRMDFLLQEVNREINTIASKSRDSEIDAITIDMKALTEQMREQVQNLE